MNPTIHLARAIASLAKGDLGTMQHCLNRAVNEQCAKDMSPPTPIGHTRKHVTWDIGGGGIVTLFSDGEVSIQTPSGDVCIQPQHWGEFCAAMSAVELVKLKPEFNRS